MSLSVRQPLRAKLFKCATVSLCLSVPLRAVARQLARIVDGNHVGDGEWR